MFQRRDGALPCVSQLITSTLSVPHVALSPLLTNDCCSRWSHTFTGGGGDDNRAPLKKASSQTDTLLIETVFCQLQRINLGKR